MATTEALMQAENDDAQREGRPQKWCMVKARSGMVCTRPCGHRGKCSFQGKPRRTFAPSDLEGLDLLNPQDREVAKARQARRESATRSGAK